MPCFITPGKFQVSYRKLSIRTPLNELHSLITKQRSPLVPSNHRQLSSEQRTCSSQSSRVASEVAGVGRRTAYSSAGITDWNSSA